MIPTAGTRQGRGVGPTPFACREPPASLLQAKRHAGGGGLTLCGVRARPAARAPGVSPDPNSAKAESYVTSNGAEKQKEQVLAVTVTSPNACAGVARISIACQCASIRPGISVRPSPLMTVAPSADRLAPICFTLLPSMRTSC